MKITVSRIVLLFSVLLHGITLFWSYRFGEFYQDDSIMYLTLAQNLREFGVLSQSFYEPLVPDAQRLPGYPVFLLLCNRNPRVVVFVQHILVFISGIFLYKTARLYRSHKVSRFAAGVFILSPLPLLFSNFLLSEVLGLWGICFAVWLWAKYETTTQTHYAIASAVTISILFYVKPIVLVYIPVFILTTSGLMFYRKKNTLAMVVMLIPVFVLLPWALRYYTITEKVGLTTLVETNSYYGRLGGFSAWLSGENHRNDAAVFVAADSVSSKFANNKLLEKNIKTHYGSYQTQETELINIPVSKILGNLIIENPFAYCVWSVEVLGQQFFGVGYETAFQISHNKLVSSLFSFMQIIISGVWLMAIAIYVKTIRTQSLLCHVIIGTVILHSLATAVGWADSRFRIPVEPLLCLLAAFNIFGGANIFGSAYVKSI